MGILQEGRTCQRVAHASRAAVLIDGADYYAALAASWQRAERSILMVGWDFNSRTRLLRDGENGERSSELGALLDALVRRRPSLDVHVLAWDFAMIYALERETLPLLRFGLGTHGRVHFQLDDRHPLGGSHHQKIVVVDDRVAFAGGLDITACRWDTPDHAAEDPRRRDAGFGSYGPFHDVQLMVEGDVAASLGELVRERWRAAVGKPIPAPDRAGDVWPDGVEADFEDVHVGVARTVPELDDRPVVDEIFEQYVTAIRSARHSVYVENQYFSATRIADVLAERLEEEDGPEVVMILPASSGGWLEEATMGIRRERLLARLHEADRWHRLRVYHPRVPDVADAEFTVHAKLLIIDDESLRVGSSNLSNRSMGLDSECDLTIEAKGDDAIRRRIRRIQARLLAEHLGSTEETVVERAEASSSLITVIEDLRVEGRTLVEIDPRARDADGWVDSVLSGAEMLDPERPISFEAWLRAQPDEEEAAAPFGLVRRLAVAAVVAGLAVWLSRSSAPGDGAAVDPLAAAREWLAAVPYLAPLAVAAAALASLACVPLTAVGLVYGILLPPFTAAIGLALGAAVSVYPGYWLGRSLWRDTIRRLAGRHLNRLSRALTGRGAVGIARLRHASRSAFGVINLVAGANRVPFRSFAWGTGLALVPGTLLVVAWTHLAWRLAREPWGTPLVLGIAGVVLLGAAILRRWPVSRDRSRD